MVKIGDYVTRKKYGNDIVFIVDKINGQKVFLKGVDVRLYADSSINDLMLSPIPKKKEKITQLRNISKDEYFYIPGTVLHLDSDKSYLDKCLELYKEQNIKAFGFLGEENIYPSKIISLINKYKPNIVVITGHDAHYSKPKDGKNYKNSMYFEKTVKEIKNNNYNTLIFAGACQSDFKSLINAGATYASSPKTVNIHALDPAIVASYLALSDYNTIIDIKDMISKTHFGSDGIGGVIGKGSMKSVYPRRMNN